MKLTIFSVIPLNTEFRDYQRELIVLTDGEDNCSKEENFESIRKLIAEPGIPNFHFILIGVCFLIYKKPLHITPFLSSTVIHELIVIR